MFGVAAPRFCFFDEYAVPRSETDYKHRAFIDCGDRFGRGFDYLWRSASFQVCMRSPSLS